MAAVSTFEGPLSVLRAMGVDARQPHHLPALWARWPFSVGSAIERSATGSIRFQRCERRYCVKSSSCPIGSAPRRGLGRIGDGCQGSRCGRGAARSRDQQEQGP